ncbi:unnamed protein product [Fusarium equiseti]|uniref:Uncharacterized protein n=1 Tax=Fusarium equiseti TaxID=61235 RepID=A0A8J2NDN1_FUSEQ|nr:unnamed protein product [Fusarium equiseti]
MDNCRQDLVSNTHAQHDMVGSVLDHSPKSLRLDLLEEKRKRSLCEEEIRTQRERIAELEGELKSLQRCKPDANVRHNLEQHLAATRAMIGENKARYRKTKELSLSDIGRRILALSNAIRDFGLTNEEISDELPGLESNFGPSVQSWAIKTFGRNIRLCIYSVFNREFRKEGLLRGLVAAAVNELIFEPVFPHIFNVHSQDTNFYRKYIVVRHGTEDLHHADHHVLKELARDKQTAMIEPTANNLADRISKNLEGLLSTKEDQPPQQQDLDGDFDMLYTESDVDTTTLHLRSVLSQALAPKLDLTMHMNRLRFFFFKPNDIWDARNMKLDDPSFRPDESSSIKACISPAIYVAPKREVNRDEAILEFDTRFNTYFLEATEDEVKTLDAGHVIVHFLMTGTYQCLRSTSDALKGRCEEEFRTAVCVYVAAMERKLPGLRDLARQQVAKLGQQLDLLTVISVIEDCGSTSQFAPGTFHPGTVGYLQFRIQSFAKNATATEAKDMLDKLETPQTLSKILLKSLILMKLPTQSKPEDKIDQETDNVSAEKDSVQLAEEAILETENVYQRAKEQAERETREAGERERAEEQRQKMMRDNQEMRELEDMKVRDGKLSHSKRRRLAQLREEEALRAHQATNTEPKQPAEHEPRDEPVAASSALIKHEQLANTAVEVPNGSDSLNGTCM